MHRSSYVPRLMGFSMGAAMLLAALAALPGCNGASQLTGPQISQNGLDSLQLTPILPVAPVQLPDDQTPPDMRSRDRALPQHGGTVATGGGLVSAP